MFQKCVDKKEKKKDGCSVIANKQFFRLNSIWERGKARSKNSAPSPRTAFWYGENVYVLVLFLTLIHPTHFEDVQCQSGVNHIYDG